MHFQNRGSWRSRADYATDNPFPQAQLAVNKSCVDFNCWLRVTERVISSFRWFEKVKSWKVGQVPGPPASFCPTDKCLAARAIFYPSLSSNFTEAKTLFRIIMKLAATKTRTSACQCIIGAHVSHLKAARLSLAEGLALIYKTTKLFFCLTMKNACRS